MLTMAGKYLENTKDWDKSKRNVRAGRHLVVLSLYTLGTRLYKIQKSTTDRSLLPVILQFPAES